MIVSGQVLFTLPFSANVAAIRVPRGKRLREHTETANRSGLPAFDRVLRKIGARSLRRVHAPFPEWSLKHTHWASKLRLMDSTFLLHFDPDKWSSEEVVSMLSEFKSVQQIQPNVFYRPSRQGERTPPDWASTVDIGQTWNLTRGRSEIKIAIIDTGIMKTHLEFEGTALQIKTGCDVVDCSGVYPPQGVWAGDYQVRDDDPSDDEGHGTMMSALIGGKTCGLAPGCTLVPVRALATSLSGIGGEFKSAFAKADDLARALRFATDCGANVINMSYGNAATDGMPTHFAERQAIGNAIDHGCFLAAAMGNDGDEGVTMYPSAYPGVCAVAAIDGQDDRWPSSQVGAHCSLSAPGVSLQSALLNGGYGRDSGTSQATAVVSAAAGLVLSAYIAKGKPLPTGKQLASLLTGTARTLSDGSRSTEYGYGCVDVSAAIARIGP